ncbi:MAG: DUF748 domain-containing protein [Candidatus Didemnitutus sp.]|nr:DUF748 domain-containing protein [Candidatus Didemnitutus sp.]
MNWNSCSPRARRNLGIFAGLLVVFTIVGFFVVPPIVRTQIERRASEALGRQVTVGKVRFNPYTLGLTLERLDVRTADGAGSFLGWERLYVNFDALASLGGDWVLGDIELDGFHAAVALESDGKFNFADILAKLVPPADPAAPTAPTTPSRPLRVVALKVAQARVEFADRSRTQPFATTLGPLSFDLKNFRTVTEDGAPYQFEAVTEAGERLRWVGTLIAAPFRSEGELVLENILLPKYAPYYADAIRADLTGGRLTVRGRYAIDLTPDRQMLRLAEGAVSLQGVKLQERGTEVVALDLPAFAVTGIQFDALQRSGVIGQVQASDGRVVVRREADGGLNWLAMLPPPAPAAVAAPAVAPAAPPAALPDVRVTLVDLRNFQIELTDLAGPRPAKLGLGGLQLKLENLSLADGATMPLMLAFDWAPQGRVTVQGEVGVLPSPRADLAVDVASFALLPLSPYLEQQLNARLAQGAVTTQMQVKVVPGGQGPAADLAGTVRIDELNLVDGVMGEPLAGFASLELKGLKAASAPELALALEEVVLTGPFARVIVREDKTLNLAGLVRAAPEPVSSASSPETSSATPAAPASAPAPKIEVGKVTIAAGDFSLTDRSLAPQVRSALGKFGGTVGSISSSHPARAAVDLRGEVDGVGPVAITGWLDPLGTPRLIDLQVDFRNVDLLAFSPYSGKYAGYELARGKFALAVKAKVEGERLQSENVITLSQFTFGAPVDSPDATKLPVRLGVALLKDLDGQIIIDVPMSGDVNDPNLRIGRVVGRVIVNLLTKAAVSPFALLGSMFGGGGDELAFQEFEPGLAVLRPAEQAKLDTMVKALANRPGLSLGLEGGYDGPADTFALRRLKVAALVRAKLWEELHLADPNLPPPDKLEISAEQHAAKLKQLFDEKFPPGTEFGTPLPAAPAVAQPPPPPKSFFRRIVHAITFAGVREKRAAAKENERRAAEHAQAVAAAQAAGLPVEEMTGRLAETMEVSTDDLRALAAARAQRVRDYFVQEGKVAPDRLFLTQAKEGQTENKGPRVYLALQ